MIYTFISKNKTKKKQSGKITKQYLITLLYFKSLLKSFII